MTQFWSPLLLLTFIFAIQGLKYAQQVEDDAILEFPKKPQKALENRINKGLAQQKRNGYNENHETKSRANLSV